MRVGGAMTLKTRKEAIYKGLKFYDGKPCIKCGMTKRHISGNCYYCQKYYNERYKNKKQVGLELSDKEYEKFMEVVEICSDECKSVILDTEMQSSIIAISREIEIWNDLKSLTIRMAKELARADFTNEYGIMKDDTYWDWLSYYHDQVRKLFPEQRISKIWANMTEEEKLVWEDKNFSDNEKA